MSDASGQTAWSYDSMGRIVIEQRTIGSVTKTIRYGYNKDGSLAQITYPSGSVLKYSYGSDGRPVSVVDSTNSINYATSATYAPPGGLASIVYGEVSGGFAGITTSNSYNSRLFPTALSASSTNGAALSLSYAYFANGNVNVETNGRDNGRTATYTYDALNRVSTASSQATSGSDCWGQSFGYDRYANLTTINVTQCTAPMLSLSVNTNNQITNTGFTYDADGDLTGDGTYSYSWNAEQHLTSAASVTYTYDGNLNRVKKSSGTLYWYSPAGVPLAETDTGGNTLNEYVFLGSARIARRDSSGNVYYYFQDKLGTTGTLSNSSGVLCYDADFLPFGYEMAHTTSCSQNYKFTGLERDGETGLDHTLNRKYDSSLGRWLSPDPKGANVSNPQSLNRYAYVLNGPTGLTDPLGLQCVPGAPGYENDCPEPPEPPDAGGSGGGGGAGGGWGGSGPAPCSNVVRAGGLRPSIKPCGLGGGGTLSLLAKEAAALNNVAGAIAAVVASQTIFSLQELECIAAIETGCTFNPNAVGNYNGVTYYGLFQMSYATFQTSRVGFAWNGGASMFNPTLATEATLGALYAYLGYSGVQNPTQQAVTNALNRYGGDSTGAYGKAVMNCAQNLVSGNFGAAMGVAAQYDLSQGH
jgi:RHS repeat-associated protein